MFLNNLYFDSIYVRNSSVEFVKTILMYTRSISILKLNGNKLTVACNILPPLRKIFLTDLSVNQIRVIKTACFQSAPYLTEITLSHNNLTAIHQKAFFNLQLLAILNLSHNKLKHFTLSVLIASSNLIMLNLQNNTLEDFSSKIMSQQELQFLSTENYYVCCFISRNVSCITTKPWYFSCNSLLSNNQLQRLVCTICIFIFILNISCILLQQFLAKSNYIGFYQILIALNATDMIYGAYLMFLLIASKHHTHEFVKKTSPICLFIFALILHFNISSILFNFLSTLCRFMIVKYPVETKFKQPEYLFKLIASLFALSCLFTFMISIIMQLFNFPITNPFCTPFIDPSNSILLIKALVHFIVVCQFLATSAITTLYILLLNEMKVAAEKVQNSSLKKVSHVSILMQIAVLISANTLTWIPSGIIYFFAMMMEKYPMEIVLWTIITIGPISAVVTPSVFVGTTLRKILKQKVKL